MNHRRHSHPSRRALGLGLTALALALPLVGVPEPAGASSHGPFPGFTGAPGEDTCRHCHSTFALNTPGGQVFIEGFPETYTPGETYPVTVRLESAAGSHWGFEATVLDENDKHSGRVVATDRATTKVVYGYFIPDRIYIEQKTAGSYLGQREAATWTFAWRAPKKAKGRATMYVCGNAGNSNGKDTGDFIYFAQASSEPAS